MALSSFQRSILDGNPLTTIAGAVLRGLPALASLHLQEMELSENLLLNLSLHGSSFLTSPEPSDPDLTWPNITHLYFKRFRYCSYLPWIPDCRPKTDGVSSFENLLIRRELRVAVWLVATLTLIGNLTVLTGRLLTRDDNKLLSLFIRNLAVSDLLTGVYLVIVGVKDLQFRSVYHENAHSWMTSRGCAVTGVLAMTSSEVSVLVLAFMSVERLVCIGRPLRSPRTLPGLRPPHPLSPVGVRAGAGDPTAALLPGNSPWFLRDERPVLPAPPGRPLGSRMAVRCPGARRHQPDRIFDCQQVPIQNNIPYINYMLYDLKYTSIL
nr:relaxin receptor 1-like [Penaeus vannamei]